MSIDDHLDLSAEKVEPPTLEAEKIEKKTIKPITFPGLEEFQNSPVLFHERLTARYNSLSLSDLDRHFHSVQQKLLAAGTDLEKQREANSFEDLQLAMMHQLRKGAKRLQETKEEEKKEKPLTAKAKKEAAAKENIDSALFD